MKYALLIACLSFACGSKSKPVDNPPPGGTPAAGASDCVKGGCSGTICEEPGNQTVTTCEFKPEYACYKDATCERQGDGKCAWTQSPALTACLANPPKADATGGAPQ